MPDREQLSRAKNLLRESDIFEGLAEVDLYQVAAIGEQRNVSKGQRLASAGSRGREVFTLLRGQLRVLAVEGGREVSVRLAHPNETVPLAALLDPPVLVTTVEAGVDSEVFAIPRAKLVELCEREPAIGLHVYREVAKIFERRYRAMLGRPRRGGPPRR